MLRVCLSYIHFPMAIGRFFENALRRRDDIELVTIGPYSGSWIPWNGGMNVQKHTKPPDIPLPFQRNEPILVSSINYVENLLPWEPDLWIQVSSGWQYKGKPSYGKNFIIGTDPHVIDYSYQRTIADKFFCMQTPYIEVGDIYLPYAYDPQVHFVEEKSQTHDVCLLGIHYRKRDQIVQGLREKGVKVNYDLGPIFDEYRISYMQAPIGINWSSEQDLTARVFELLAMKRFAVVNDVPDLHSFFKNGRDLIAVKSAEEAIEAVIYYLDDHKARNSIARDGFKVVQEHTWDARITQILDSI